ncbi:MAG TPA: hypothetical protein VG777_06695 [Thermoanaerobaculia bacterium]|nr:hypothetical protein [Thermoanaerobaculia bacterium]
MKPSGAFAALAALLASAAACATALPPATPETEAGRAIYSAKCHSCHRLYKPDRVSADKWPALLDKMAEKAKLTPDEEKAVLDWILAVSAPAHESK